jgi:hypothetical protein
VLLSLAGCARSPGDGFEALCREHASESVIESSAAGPVAMWWRPDQFLMDSRRWEYVALDERYAPVVVARALLSGPDRLELVHLRYGLRATKDAGARCYPLYFHEATESSQMQPSFDCARARRVEVDVDRDPDDLRWRYAIEYEFGATRPDGIRPFTFRLVDGASHVALVEQRSFLLLPSAALSTRPVAHAGLEPVPGVRSCPMTAPDVLVKRAFKPWTPTSARSRPGEPGTPP